MQKFGCNGKQRYKNKIDALSDIYRRMNESAGGCVDLRPYKCKSCKGFHLTSQIK
jgi:predicted Zn-ribbon and HTH transcriptional regulator